jgi:hypothetical protein
LVSWANAIAFHRRRHAENSAWLAKLRGGTPPAGPPAAASHPD